ncbi:MAG TPA: VOC family protein [Ramlibacter sp.]|nr:VOC family protein [Ramlibacter sp.]
MSGLLIKPGEREPLQSSFSDASNPVGLDGVEFIEYSTPTPQALGQVLEMMGFKPVMRHRSREVMLYRQGGINVVVNAHPADVTGATHGGQAPAISAIALRVRDARAAYDYVLERGAWDVPGHAEVMELNIPAIHGAGGSRIYFVDRYKDFSIYDVDFVPIPQVDTRPPALAGMHFFGVVQYIGAERSHDWIEFYRELFGFALIPDEQRFGIMPKGKLMRSPALDTANGFMLQLVEPDLHVYDSQEKLQRIGLGVPDVLEAVKLLRQRGVEFVETQAAHTEARGAITKTYLGSVVFELVHSESMQTPTLPAARGSLPPEGASSALGRPSGG